MKKKLIFILAIYFLIGMVIYFSHIFDESIIFRVYLPVVGFCFILFKYCNWIFLILPFIFLLFGGIHFLIKPHKSLTTKKKWKIVLSIQCFLSLLCLIYWYVDVIHWLTFFNHFGFYKQFNYTLYLSAGLICTIATYKWSIPLYYWLCTFLPVSLIIQFLILKPLGLLPIQAITRNFLFANGGNQDYLLLLTNALILTFIQLIAWSIVWIIKRINAPLPH